MNLQQSHISPIKLKVSIDQLTALNSVWKYSAYYMVENKATPSILLQLIKKLKTKETNQLLKFTKKKEFTISFLPYEAYFFERYILDVINQVPKGYEKTIINKIAGKLNQELT